ncbi:MAG: four helix bundle protein [bacterium]
MGLIKHFRDLIVWQKAHELTLYIYKCTDSFPKKEQFSLTDQMRRASISVGSNIAEGFSRLSIPDKIHFFAMAKGSLTELENQIYIARDVGYLKYEAVSRLGDLILDEGRLLTAIMKSTRNMSQNAI